MQTPSDTIETYLLAKDGNRPHLIERAFAGGALLRMDVRQGDMGFPPVAHGRDAIAETLVRRFGRTYENVYSFCLADPPDPACAEFHCPWLVAMTEKDSRAVRLGCGQYHWRFAPGSRLAQELSIVVDSMQTLPPSDIHVVMPWIAALSRPWCGADKAMVTAPSIPSVRAVLPGPLPSGPGGLSEHRTLSFHFANHHTMTQLAPTTHIPRWQFWIDRGGTFTDIVAKRPDGSLTTHKLLSENPEQYKDAAVAGIRHLLGLKPGEPVTPALVECVKRGPPVATNALLERKGEPTLLVTTRGFRDALRIAYQNRPRLFDRHIQLPELL